MYNVKMNPDGFVARFKARLVLKDMLKHMELTTDTFSLVAKLSFIRIIISLTAKHH